LIDLKTKEITIFKELLIIIMTKLLYLSLFLLTNCSSPEQNQLKTFLALGDSYTIGESVEVNKRWPNQLVSQANATKTVFEEAKIIARTGWTTDELLAAIGEEELLPDYDLVSLMIGVNNQYRGRSPENFREEFLVLLDKSIALSKKAEAGVMVLSIPDWGVTPFAFNRNKTQIAQEINLFNSIIQNACIEAGVAYFDITPISRQAAVQPELVASDGLHPSSTMYALWVAEVLPFLTN
jgi:lysophospholipase L1-like esterase